MAPRKKIVELAKMVGGLPGMVFKIDEDAPEYYALECVVSDEQVDVALAMGLRKQRSAQEIAERCRKPLEETSKLLYELAQIGVCQVSNVNGTDQFYVQIFAPGILEMMVNNREQLQNSLKSAKLSRNTREHGWPHWSLCCPWARAPCG